MCHSPLMNVQALLPRLSAFVKSVWTVAPAAVNTASRCCPIVCGEIVATSYSLMMWI